MAYKESPLPVLSMPDQHLGLPPAHIFAPELFSWAALRFAAL